MSGECGQNSTGCERVARGPLPRSGPRGPFQHPACPPYCSEDSSRVLGEDRARGGLRSQQRLVACVRACQGPSAGVCRGAAILSSLKRPAILSPFSAMKEDGTDGGVAVEAVGGGSAVGRGEAHAAGGGARAPALGATGAPRSTGRGARGPGGAAARQRRAGAGEQAPRGVAGSIDRDQHGALQRNDDHWTPAEELRGKQDPTQVGQALQALEIEAIYALSPQAKGRVERLWGTLQDRLVSELRLAGARTIADANAVLERYRPVTTAASLSRPRTPHPRGGRCAGAS